MRVEISSASFIMAEVSVSVVVSESARVSVTVSVN
jgi:hypothetical protein